MSTSSRTRSGDLVWLIGQPLDTIKGARLPSGKDVMRNFIYFHRIKKYSINQSAACVYNQIKPFWDKSRLPIKQKAHVLNKIKDLYAKRQSLNKNRKRNNEKDQQNQKIYCDILNKLFDISHAYSQELIKNDEDRKFLELQKISRTGCIGPVDKKLFDRELRKREREEKFANRLQATTTCKPNNALKNDMPIIGTDVILENPAADKSNEEKFDEEYVVRKYHGRAKSQGHDSKNLPRSVITPKIAAVLDRSNISIRKSTMIMASVINETCSTSSNINTKAFPKSKLISKSTVYRERNRLRRESAEQLKTQFEAKKSIVHWDGKMLPDMAPSKTGKVDRLAIMISSAEDKSTKLLGVPKLISGTGKAAADAVFDHLKSWKSENEIIGMCFDTTSTNTGKDNGACTLLENKIGRNLLWLACRHHMLEILLSDAFNVCLGPSTGPEILIFKRFREKWPQLNHTEPQKQSVPKIPVSDSLKTFVSDQQKIAAKLPRDDYREFLNLASLIIGLDIKFKIRKPGALHRARWMAKAIYSLKIELLFRGNETIIGLTAKEFQGLKRFNRFVVNIYLQSWFTCRSAVDALANDIFLIQRLKGYDDKLLSERGLKLMLRHSWYLSEEVAVLGLFSSLLTEEQKSKLVVNMKKENYSRSHTLKYLPLKIEDLCISYSFFEIVGIDDAFLRKPVKDWPNITSYKKAELFFKNLTCVNDIAEQGVALIQEFNSATRNEEQKQYLLQVVEEHRKKFSNCNRQNLYDI